MPAFKSDESFLEKISLGAIGTQKVFEHLRSQGFNPIELERGSMNYKIWKKIKIKRIRVPDILLVDCGLRIESRAKSKLVITMSHSESDPERGWNYGMRDDDFVALVACEKSGESPVDWTAQDLVQYVQLKALSDAFQNRLVEYVKPKGAEEGFEARIIWPAAVASSSGAISEITTDKIKFKREQDGRTISLKLTKKGITLKPLVAVGERIQQNQIIASVVPVYQSLISPKVDVEYYLRNLNSNNLSERYAAAKALGQYESGKSIKYLKKKLSDSDEHIYVKLETAATLARFGKDEGFSYLETTLKDQYAQNVLETVIILAEVKDEKSIALLIKVLEDESYDPEIRAGAAWALGEQNLEKALPALVRSFNAVDDEIKVEAARALGKLTGKFTPDLLQYFETASLSERPGISWALAKSKSLNVADLVQRLQDLDSRQWASFILGSKDSNIIVNEVEKIRTTDPEVYFATTVLWKVMSSWVYELKEY